MVVVGWKCQLVVERWCRCPVVQRADVIHVLLDSPSTFFDDVALASNALTTKPHHTRRIPVIPSSTVEKCGALHFGGIHMSRYLSIC